MQLQDRLLIVVNIAVVLATVAWAVHRLRPEETTPAAPPPAETGPRGTTLAMARAVRIDQVEAMPLFHRSRQPVAKATLPAAPPVSPTPVSIPVLRGIVGSPDHLGALLEDEAGKEQKLVYAGGRFGEWTLTEIRPRRARLVEGTHIADLALRPGEAKPPPASRTAAPASVTNMAPKR